MKAMKGLPRTSGVIAAALTPMAENLDADSRLLADHCGWLLNAGCSSIVVLGTTGEANSFTLREREELLGRLIDAGVPPSALIVGTGCCAVADTARLTKHAARSGITRVLMLPPFYYKGVSDDGIFEAFACTIEALGNSCPQIFLYQIPQLSGVEFSFDLIDRLLEEYPGAVAGIKDSAGDWPKTKALCARFGRRISVLVGSERFLLPALAAGAAGCVTATANATAPAIARLYERRDDPAAAQLQAEVAKWRTAIESFPMIPALKEIVATRSGIDRWRVVRAPLSPLSASTADELRRRLDASMPRSGS